jgi:N-acetylglucosaminyldiphosphoundecaprenol N-acetyl-beta-D-mannosaminyltransferase
MDISDRKILGMRVAVTLPEDAMRHIVKMANTGRSEYVCVANVHMCMEAFDSLPFRQVVNSAALVVPDGRPLAWGLRAIGERQAHQVRGADLMAALCQEAQQQGLPIGLYGGSRASLKGLINFLERRYPAIEIRFAASPPFRELTLNEDAIFVDDIRSCGIRILFVGLGCPKQETWMAEHRDRIRCVMVGVGAVFDFFSRQKKQAPRWMQVLGLEWLFRLASEPRRLWKRYLFHNPRFIWYFGQQLLGHDVEGMR